MSVVKLQKCIARPDVQGEPQGLVEHLEKVAEKCGDKKGKIRDRLLYLAGLMHDAGKARLKWQRYVLEGGERGEVVHSPLGAALFTYLAKKMLLQTNMNQIDYKKGLSLVLRLSMDIADHHSKLKDIKENITPWSPYPLETFVDESDVEGLIELAKSHLNIKDVGVEDFKTWLKFHSTSFWRKSVIMFRGYINYKISNSKSESQEAAKFCMRNETAALIAADRYHASGVVEDMLRRSDVLKAIKRLENKCKFKALKLKKDNMVSEEILKKRQQVQDASLKKFRNVLETSLYGLFLPTGLGKTITSLRIALENAIKSQTSRIIYVAPYLSILSQSAKEIYDVTGIEVLQHHHLSLVENTENIDELGYLALESWQAPIIATTFNQFFRALFPSTAQQTLRLKGLIDSFVIIDEPQIMDISVWNLFLKQLKAASKEYGFKVLFSTATMPNCEEGLDGELTVLSPKIIKIKERYKCVFNNTEMDQSLLAKKVVQSLNYYNSTAVILNTVKDAYLVFEEVKNELISKKEKGVKVFYISGLMTPLHKSIKIKEIMASLISGEKTIVVSTQILEAGVNLSFRKIFRALPIIPSIVQSAGRANRHGEGAVAEVEVFVFKRNGEVDTRNYVYNNVPLKETEKTLKSLKYWGESESYRIIKEYYRRIFTTDPNTFNYNLLKGAALGKWSKLANVQPFEQDWGKINVFVNWGEQYLPEKVKVLMDDFKISKIEEIFDKYLCYNFLSSLSFLERKKFMTLLNNFTVSVPLKSVKKLDCIEFEDKRLAKLKNKASYNVDVGLASILSE